ncbi:MAG: hypothetical protein GY860_00845 [Desulfobacteraceae bacterium]|nr:hypothetical protein [Desulfobacteraceae bacterium]
MAKARVLIRVALGLENLSLSVIRFYFGTIVKTIIQRKMQMKTKMKVFNNEKFEVLEHDEVPGFRKAFHIIISVAAIYLIYIFYHSL